MTKEEIQNELQNGGSSFVGAGGIGVSYNSTTNVWTFTGTLDRGTERAGVDGLVGTTPRTGTHRIYNDSGRTRVIDAVRATVTTPDSGTALIVDVKREGTSIFLNAGSRPTIAVNGTTNKATSMGGASVWNDGQYITIEVPQAGAAHANLDVNVEWVS